MYEIIKSLLRALPDLGHVRGVLINGVPGSGINFTVTQELPQSVRIDITMLNSSKEFEDFLREHSDEVIHVDASDFFTKRNEEVRANIRTEVNGLLAAAIVYGQVGITGFDAFTGKIVLTTYGSDLLSSFVANRCCVVDATQRTERDALPAHIADRFNTTL